MKSSHFVLEIPITDGELTPPQGGTIRSREKREILGYRGLLLLFSLLLCCLVIVAQSRLILATPWTVTCQAPLSVGFPSQEYWSVLPFLLHKI